MIEVIQIMYKEMLYLYPLKNTRANVNSR